MNNRMQNNPMLMIQQFNNFRQMFKGNPREVVQGLLSSGQMSQNQFNDMVQKAQMFAQMMNQMKI